MPEGHVTHRLADTISADFAGQVVTSSSPQGRFAAEAARITGRTLISGEAYGKHRLGAFYRILERGPVHRGLAGKLQCGTGAPPAPVGAIRWRMAGEHSYADLRGPAACELLRPDEVTALLARLGPDPLRDDADPEVGWQRVRTSTMSIGALLMDQRVAAGVGNIFRAEVLYRHRIDPMMQGRLLRRAEWEAIWDDLVELMHAALAIGRIDTVRPEHTPEAMGRPPRVDRLGGVVYVYRRTGQRCLVCGSVVRTAELAGRNLFWCPGCQRRSRRRVPR
jgi:formamidopyrimidine-DNA glycosylase